MNQRQQKSGFTLVELLMVMAIIVLLLALLLPTFRAAKSLARSVKCGSNQHQLGIAIQTREAERRVNTTMAKLAPGVWYSMILPYTNSPELFVCPEDFQPAEGYDVGNNQGGPGGDGPVGPANNGAGGGGPVTNTNWKIDAVLRIWPSNHIGQGSFFDVDLVQDLYTMKISEDQYLAARAGTPKYPQEGRTFNPPGYTPGANPNTYFLGFEDLRPPRGIDFDYEDVLMKVVVTDSAGASTSVTIYAMHGGVGQAFELVKKSDPSVKLISPINGNNYDTPNNWQSTNQASADNASPGNQGGGGGSPGTGAVVGIQSTRLVAYYRTSYGMNSLAPSVLGDGRKIVLLDYLTEVARVADSDVVTDPWSEWQGPNGLPAFARHLRGVNLLMGDSAVRDRVSVMTFDPHIPANQAQWWKN